MRYDSYRYKVPPEKQVRLITVTDAKNEADDQFAVVHALLSPKFDHAGFIAAHFGTRRCADSMERSYAELETIFDLMGFDPTDMLCHGAPHPMEEDPVDSEGARLIIREAMKDDPRPLYVACLGPLTDLAAALMIEPRIAGRLTALWIGGGPYPHGGPEANLRNDIQAANIVFSSAVPLWQIPQNVYERMPVSMAELEYRVRPCGRIGAYLCDQMQEYAWSERSRKGKFRTGESWILGDNPAIGLLLYEQRYHYHWQYAPNITSDMAYLPSANNRPIRIYDDIDSRIILEDLFCKIALFSNHSS